MSWKDKDGGFSEQDRARLAEDNRRSTQVFTAEVAGKIAVPVGEALLQVSKAFHAIDSFPSHEDLQIRIDLAAARESLLKVLGGITGEVDRIEKMMRFLGE